MKIIFINIFIVVLISLSSASAEINISELKDKGYEVIIKPKSLNFSELYEEMYPIKANLKSAIDLNLGQCEKIDEKNLVFIDSYYQNILYKDYEWIHFGAPNGKECIKITKPDLGLLSQDKAMIFINASQGIGFEYLGYWNDAYQYAREIDQFSENCLNSSYNKVVLARDDELFKNTAYLYDNTILDKTTCNHTNAVAEKENIAKDRGGYKAVFNNDRRIEITNPDSLGGELAPQAYIVRVRDSGGIGECRLRGSGFYINPYTIVTAAHNIKFRGCKNKKFDVMAYVAPNYRKHYTARAKRNKSYNSIWKMDGRDGYAINDFINDYGVLRQSTGHFLPIYSPIITSAFFPIIGNPKTDSGEVLGYPESVRGENYSGVLFGDFFPRYNDPNSLINYSDSNSRKLISHRLSQTPGQSGGPFIFNQDNSSRPKPVRGIQSLDFQISGNTFNYAVAIDNYSAPDILSWAAEPPPNVYIDIIKPTYLEEILWEDLSSETFSIYIESYNFLANNSDIENNLVWESDKDGLFSNGRYVSELEAKSVLRPGNHEITVSIDTENHYGEESQFISIIGPEGSFDINQTECIIDLSSSGTCELLVSWSTADAPDAYVFNNRTQQNFSNSNQGNNVPISLIPGQDVELILYADNEKLYDMDRVTLSAKQPTGTLTSVHPNCSLQPSPYDANGNPQDPKADPPGCGTTLEWSNVQWASPGIFYRTGGSGSWQLLHQIPCALDGEICSGSLHTDDFTQQMITSSGVEFKLLQFANTGSGVLTSSFTVTAHRFADAYEFDDGWYDVPQGAGIDSHQLAAGGTISNSLGLGQVQTNHNFHRPAAYDPVVDIDAFDILKGSLPPSGAVSNQVAIEIMNMASGLDVSFEVQCVGFYDDRAGPYDDIEPMYGVWDIPFNRIVSEEFVSSDKKVMKFNYFDGYTGYYNGQFYDYPGCSRNRVLVKYQAGETGENLTYDIRAYDTSQPQGPVLDSVGPISTNNYKVELLGDNFGTNPSVSVRENVNGSSPLEVFPSTVFHNQGTHTSTGKDFIRFPIVKVNQQSKFNNNGLCFKVISGSNESNEQCLVRTPTNPQPAFMGEFLQSYHHVNQNQDIDTDAYIVKADGSLFKIWGNSWKKIPFNYTVTPNTEIELQFRSTLNEGEISGIGFVMNGESNLTGGKFWQLHGTQTDWGNQEYNNYSGTAYKTYTIKIGQKFTGQIKNIVFVGDDDQRVGQNIVFKPIVFRESGTITIDEYDDVPAQRDFDDDASGKGVSWAAGDTQHLHNFHDSGDQDWTLVYGRNVSVTTQLMGANADTDLEVYKWISATPDYNLGYYVNVVDEFVGEDVAEGASEFSIFSTTDQMFGIKASSHGNQFGAGTEYGLKIKSINPGSPDIYDASTYGDDIEGRATHWLGGDTVHYHNFDVQGDIDWTIVAVGGNFNFTVEANATGKYGGTKMTVYKWLSFDDLGGGVFTNITHQYVGQDTDGGDSLVNVHSTNGAVYAIKVESDRNAYGNNTGYTLKLH